MHSALQRALPFALLILAAVLILMSASCSGEQESPGERSLAVWSEFLADDDVRAAFPLLVEERSDLYLAIPAARIGDPDLELLLRDAHDAGVGVRAWLLLDREDGYWPNEHNVDIMRQATMAFADWRDQAALPVDWIIFDMEMSLERSEAVAAKIKADGSVAGLTMVKEGRDPETFVRSKEAFRQLVVDLQARGLKVMAVTYPLILDDPEDGDEDISDEFDVPIFDIPWNQVSFMVYQSMIFDLLGEWQGPDVVKSYADTAVELFDDRAAIALGIVGSAGITEVAMPYPDAETLLADHAAARGSAVGSISIYSLDGLLQQSMPETWIDRDVPPTHPVDVTAEYVRNLVRGLLD